MSTRTSLRRFIGTVGLLAVATIVTPQTAQATLMKTYTYTGNTFTSATGAFVGSSVSCSFTLDCASAGGAGDCSNLAFADYTSSISSWSFAAGPLTFLGPGTVVANGFTFATDSLMDVTDWDIFAAFNPGNGLSTTTSEDTARASGGIGGSNSGIPGTWTFTTKAVPEPSSLAILLVGLAALVLLLGRRRTGAAMAQEERPVFQ